MALFIFKCPYLVIGGGALLGLPWCMTVWIANRLGQSGPLFFGFSGSVVSLTTLSASLATIVSDTSATFADRLMSVVERDGISQIVLGFMGGLAYWLLCRGRGRNRMKPVGPATWLAPAPETGLP